MLCFRVSSHHISYTDLGSTRVSYDVIQDVKDVGGVEMVCFVLSRRRLTKAEGGYTTKSEFRAVLF